MPSKNPQILKKHRDSWYARNKAKQIHRQMSRRAILLQKLNDYRETLNCIDCGMSFSGKSECCDFHHINPDEKEGLVSMMARSSERAMFLEINKCVPLCANCHRTRHKSTHKSL